MPDFNYCLLSQDGKTITATGTLKNKITEFNGCTVIENNGTLKVGMVLDELTGKFKAPEVANKTPEQLQAEEYEREVQRHLDETAQSRGYDSILSACSYAGAPNPYQTESQAFITWRGDVWAYCYQVLTDVQAGTRTAPTLAELIAELPTFTG